jgi:hypothetical protein
MDAHDVNPSRHPNENKYHSRELAVPGKSDATLKIEALQPETVEIVGEYYESRPRAGSLPNNAASVSAAALMVFREVPPPQTGLLLPLPEPERSPVGPVKFRLPL